MALGTPTLKGSAGASGTSATTASFTPTANALLLAIGAARIAAGVPPTITDSLGGTWTQVHADADQEFGAINGNIYYQVVGSSPSAMTVTATSTGALHTGLHVVEITGAGTDFTNFVFDTDAAGDPSLTMAAFDASSLCMAFCVGNAGGSGYTQPSGYTELLDTAITTNLRMNSSYDVSSPGTAHTWTGVSTDTIAYGLEIKVAPSGTIYNESLAEALTVAETAAAGLIAVGSIAEALAVAETLTTTGSFNHSRAEVLAAVETQSATGIFNRSVSEALTIVDAVTGGSLQTGTVSEVLSIVETQSMALTRSGTVAETLTIVETVAAILDAVGARAEVLAAVATQSATAIFNAVRDEVLSVVDTVTGGRSIQVSRSETLTIVETVTGTVVGIPKTRAYAMII